MKNWQKYLLALTIFFITCITLTFLINSDIVNASFTNDPKLMDEEIIIIDNKNKTDGVIEKTNQSKKTNSKSNKSNVDTTDKEKKTESEENNEIEITIDTKEYNYTTTGIKENNTYTDTINGYRCYINDEENAVYYITECENKENTNALCKYSKKNGTNSTGTVLRNKLKYDVSMCEFKKNTYTDTINGDRCYVNVMIKQFTI